MVLQSFFFSFRHWKVFTYNTTAMVNLRKNKIASIFVDNFPCVSGKEGAPGQSVQKIFR